MQKYVLLSSQLLSLNHYIYCILLPANSEDRSTWKWPLRWIIILYGFDYFTGITQSIIWNTGKFARGDNSTITITRIKLWRKLPSMDFNNIILIEWQVTQMNCRWIEIHKVYNCRVKHVLYLSLTLFTDSISNDFINWFLNAMCILVSKY